MSDEVILAFDNLVYHFMSEIGLSKKDARIFVFKTLCEYFEDIMKGDR